MRPPSYVCELSTDVDPIKYQVPATLHCPHYIAVSFNVIINTHMFLKLSTCLIVEALLIVNCASILHCSSECLTLVGVCVCVKIRIVALLQCTVSQQRAIIRFQGR